jgi:DNA-binding transcriptional LysR family regulator
MLIAKAPAMQHHSAIRNGTIQFECMQGAHRVRLNSHSGAERLPGRIALYQRDLKALTVQRCGQSQPCNAASDDQCPPTVYHGVSSAAALAGLSLLRVSVFIVFQLAECDNSLLWNQIDEFLERMDAPGDMRAFVRVVERQSFSAAATSLGLTPSAVSRLVSKLEERLGLRLLHRTTRRLRLTSEGEVYFARARSILADIDEVETEVRKLRGAPRGRLSINTSNAFGIHQLAPALSDFLQRYSEIEVELSFTDRVTDLITEHADIAIRAGQVNEMSLRAQKFAEFERIICAAPSYLERRGVPHKPADLAKHVCIVAVPSSPWPFHTREGTEFLKIQPRVTSDNGEAALQLALDGVGIVRLADVIVGQEIRHGRLVQLLAEVHKSELVPLSAVYAPGRHRLPKVSVFLDFLVERFGSAPWRQ